MKKAKKSRQEKIDFSTYNKNLANMKLLVSDFEFKDLVQGFRKHLGIADKGISGHEDLKKWHADMISQSDEISGSKDFVLREVDIQEKSRENKLSYTETRKALSEHYDKVPINYLHSRVNFLIEKFRLPPNYYDDINRYIITGTIGAPYANFSIGEYPPFLAPSKANFVAIKIFSRLTNDEFQYLKKEINLFAKRLPRYKPLKNIDRDLAIEEWLNNPMREDVAEKTFYKTTTSEIAEDLLGSTKKVKAVHDVVKDVKRTRKKRFRPSGNT